MKNTLILQKKEFMVNNLLIKLLFFINQWFPKHIHLGFPNNGGIQEESVSCIFCGIDKYPKSLPMPNIIMNHKQWCGNNGRRIKLFN